MSESFAQDLDTATLLHFRGPRDERAIRASVAWHFVEVYLAAARPQTKRIVRSFEDVQRLLSQSEPIAEVIAASSAQMFADTHFYFICWSRIADLIDVVRENCGVELGLTEEQRRLLNHYRAARDALEHVEDRLPGSSHKQRRRMADQADLGNFRDGRFSFGGKEWDVDAASIRQLEGIVESLEQQIRAKLEREFAGD